jgi:hypothetical protein
MNPILSGIQSDIKAGEITLLAHDNLTGLQGFLVKVGNDSGVPKFYLITAVTDIAPFILESDDVAGKPVYGEVPSTNENARVKAYGTGSAGDILVLADPTANSGAQAGMVRSLVGNHAPTAPGKYWSFGIAEENFVDGQLVKARFLPRHASITSPLNTITDNSGGTAATPASGTVTVASIAAATTDTTAAQRVATENAFATVIASINAIKTALEAQGIVT